MDINQSGANDPSESNGILTNYITITLWKNNTKLNNTDGVRGKNQNCSNLHLASLAETGHLPAEQGVRLQSNLNYARLLHLPCMVTTEKYSSPSSEH